MNEDKADSIPTECPTCQVEMEYTDGNKRAVCHECGSQWDYTLLDNAENYPTRNNPIQQIVIHYAGTENEERLETGNPSNS